MSFPCYQSYKDSNVGWIGEIPDHWSIVPLARLSSQPGSMFIDGDWVESKDLADEGIRYITTGNVGQGNYKEQGSGYISQDTFERLRCAEVLPGDVLISRLNLPIGRACVVPDLGERIITSVDNVIVRPDDKYSASYLAYTLSSAAHFANMETLARGTTMQRISRSVLGQVRFAFPGFNEQKIIATFLDRETAKIDALIAEQQRLIELLQEKRQAVISHAVTKGLNPHAPMKDSGVEWLGEVPEHWEIIEARREIAFLTSGSRGWADYYSNSGSLFIRIGNLTRDSIELDWSDIQRVDPPSGSEGERTRVRPGDVLFSITAYLGSVAVVPSGGETAYVSQHVCLARVKERSLHPKWLGYFVLSTAGKSYLEATSYGGTKVQLSLDDIKSLPLVMPSAREQAEIMDHIEASIHHLEGLVGEAQKSISLFQERRSALISAAVTGQIDVRGLVPEAEAA
jgi:Restriction endonuclease S subunits